MLCGRSKPFVPLGRAHTGVRVHLWHRKPAERQVASTIVWRENQTRSEAIRRTITIARQHAMRSEGLISLHITSGGPAPVLREKYTLEVCGAGGEAREMGRGLTCINRHLAVNCRTPVGIVLFPTDCWNTMVRARGGYSAIS